MKEINPLSLIFLKKNSERTKSSFQFHKSSIFFGSGNVNVKGWEALFLWLCIVACEFIHWDPIQVGPGWFVIFRTEHLVYQFFLDLWKVCKLYNFTHTKKKYTTTQNEVWLWNLNGTASNLSIRIYLLESGTLLFRRLALFSRVLTLRVINPATILLFKSTVNC